MIERRRRRRKGTGKRRKQGNPGDPLRKHCLCEAYPPLHVVDGSLATYHIQEQTVDNIFLRLLRRWAIWGKAFTNYDVFRLLHRDMKASSLKRWEKKGYSTRIEDKMVKRRVNYYRTSSLEISFRVVCAFREALDSFKGMWNNTSMFSVQHPKRVEFLPIYAALKLSIPMMLFILRNLDARQAWVPLYRDGHQLHILALISSSNACNLSLLASCMGHWIPRPSFSLGLGIMWT